jgi:hypothetical protein
MNDATLSGLTREQVLAEPAGPRLDAWVALARGWRAYQRLGGNGVSVWHVMTDRGVPSYAPAKTFDRWTGEADERQWYDYGGVPKFSTEWADAGPLLEDARQNGWSFRAGPGTGGGRWAVQFKPPAGDLHDPVHADAAPLAIARAYVLARGGCL